MKGGRTPKNASSFSSDVLEAEGEKIRGLVSEAESAEGLKKTRIGWRCKLCGYIEYVDELPDDFVCPVCGATREFFERVEIEIDE